MLADVADASKQVRSGVDGVGGCEVEISVAEWWLEGSAGPASKAPNYTA